MQAKTESEDVARKEAKKAGQAKKPTLRKNVLQAQARQSQQEANSSRDGGEIVEYMGQPQASGGDKGVRVKTHLTSIKLLDPEMCRFLLVADEI